MTDLGQREKVMRGVVAHRGHDPAAAVGSGGGTWAGEGVGAGGNGQVVLRLRSESELGLGELARPARLQVCPL